VDLVTDLVTTGSTASAEERGWDRMRGAAERVAADEDVGGLVVEAP
jgi:hypothetical protein